MDEAELLQIRSEQYQRNAAVELLARDHDGDDDDDQMEFRATISSELPVTRWFGREILDHTDASIRMGRLNGGAAVLDRHHGDQIAVVTGARLNDKRQLVIDYRFSRNTPRADIIRRDVIDGIRRNVSVDYQIHAMQRDGETDGIVSFRATDWEPLGFSFEPIPADPTIGVGRKMENKNGPVETGELFDRTHEGDGVGQRLEPKPPADPATQERKVENETTEKLPDIKVIRETASSDATGQERARVADILAVGEKHGQMELARTAISEGMPQQQFSRNVLDLIASAPVSLQADIGMDKNEIRQYSIVKAIREMAANGGSIAGLTGLEREAHKAATDLYGQEARGFWIPQDVQKAGWGRTLNTGVDTAGGHTVQEDVLGDSFIELLRNAPLVAQAGATTLSGLVGNVSIPSQTGAATADWLTETGATTPSEQTFGEVTLAPKRLSAETPFSKQLIAQSSIDIESFVRRDLANIMIRTIDLASLHGTGASNQPTGIANTAGINALTFGGAPTWADAVNFETLVATDNALMGSSLAYMTTAAVRGAWKTTTKDAGSGMFLWEGDVVNGYSGLVTEQVAGNVVFFGNWTELLIGQWGGLDIVVDPFTQASNGQIRIVVMQLTDIAVRHAVSFAVSTDAGNQ